MENSLPSSIFEQEEVYKKKTSKNFLKTFTYKQTHGVSHLCATPYSKLTRCWFFICGKLMQPEGQTKRTFQEQIEFNLTD